MAFAHKLSISSSSSWTSLSGCELSELKLFGEYTGLCSVGSDSLSSSGFYATPKIYFNKLVVDIAGEASVLMTMQEMSTAVLYSLPIKIFIIKSKISIIGKWS